MVNSLQTLEAASLALGGLRATSALIPDKALFIYAYVRKEAVLSSQIEGSRSSLTGFAAVRSGRGSRRACR